MVKPPLDDAINSCHRGLDGMSVTVLAKIDGAPTQDVPASFVLVTNRDGIRELEDAYDPEG